MKRDIRINYSVLDEIAASIHTYKNNIESMKETLDKIHTKIEENSGKSIDALKESYQDVSKDMTKSIEELNELHTLFSEYVSSMEQHIKAINREKIVQVDRDDIWMNIKSIENGYYRITELNNTTHLFNGSFFADEEQKEIEESNGDKIEEIKALARQCVSKLDYKIEEINYLFNTKVVPFEDTDDQFASQVEPIYNKYTSNTQKIINTLDEFGDNLKDLQLGFVNAVKDLIVFAFELVEGIIINTAAAVTLAVTYPMECQPKWAKDTFTNTKDSITAIIKDPMLILEGISQGVSDAVDTKGIAYCTGYAVGGLVGQKGIDKVLKGIKSVGVAGEVAQGVDEVVATSKGINGYIYSTEEWYSYLKRKYGNNNVYLCTDENLLIKSISEKLEDYRLVIDNEKYAKSAVAYDGKNLDTLSMATSNSHEYNPSILTDGETFNKNKFNEILKKCNAKEADAYSKYYEQTLTEEYIRNSISDEFFVNKGIMKDDVILEIKKLTNAIENTKNKAMDMGKFSNLTGKPSFQDWNVENCAEVWSVRKAILNGAKFDDVNFKCVISENGKYAKPCKNCKETFNNLNNIGAKK